MLLRRVIFNFAKAQRMDSFFSWFSLCRRQPPKKRRTRNAPSIPSPPPLPPPLSQNAVFENVSIIVDDLEFLLVNGASDDDGESLIESKLERDNQSAASAQTSAAALRITLLARGTSTLKTRHERDVRMRYVTVACERLFVTLDALKPIDVIARETRRALLQRLLIAEKNAELVSKDIY